MSNVSNLDERSLAPTFGASLWRQPTANAGDVEAMAIRGFCVLGARRLRGLPPGGGSRADGGDGSTNIMRLKRRLRWGPRSTSSGAATTFAGSSSAVSWFAGEQGLRRIATTRRSYDESS